MARSISRNPLFHKGLIVFTSNGTALPRAEPFVSDSPAQETGSSDNEVLDAHHSQEATEEHP